MSKILVIRFSAIGDVAMTVPVIYSLAKQYPEHEITVLSRESLRSLFLEVPANVHFIGVDLKGKYKGLSGLSRLFAELRILNFDFVADLHNVLRSKYLRYRFCLAGISAAYIRKDRLGKKKLVRRRCKVLKELEPSFSRYEKVFEKLGFTVCPDFTSIYKNGKGDFSLIRSYTGEKGEDKWLGIAPFAKHKGKIYPLHLQEQVIAGLATDKKIRIFLFGAGKEEEAVFDSWTAKYPGSVFRIRELRMNTELVLMSYLDAMLSMDSANMHLASLVNTPVVSVWGATHPYAGFMGWEQSPQNAVQIDLSCRPCSVYGQKPCFRGDYACLNRITPKMIIERIEAVLCKQSVQ